MAKTESTRAALAKDVDKWIELARQRLADWQKRLEENPTSAMESSTVAFEQAAKLEILVGVKSALEKGKSIRDLYQGRLQYVLQKSRFGSHSTSTCANFMYECRLSEMAQFLEHLEYYAEKEKEEG